MEWVTFTNKNYGRQEHNSNNTNCRDTLIYIPTYSGFHVERIEAAWNNTQGILAP